MLHWSEFGVMEESTALLLLRCTKTMSMLSYALYVDSLAPDVHYISALYSTKVEYSVTCRSIDHICLDPH